jgi:hypothetical protein
MCGIVGYIGKRSACEILINGLKRLEYRGYDSAGIALNYNAALTVAKRSGKVTALESSLHQDIDREVLDNAVAGIAHTRWATHGLPTGRMRIRIWTTAARWRWFTTALSKITPPCARSLKRRGLFLSPRLTPRCWPI